jgi:hypothetical protein
MERSGTHQEEGMAREREIDARGDSGAKVRDPEARARALAEMERLAHEIGRAWISPQSGVDLVADQRRRAPSDREE